MSTIYASPPQLEICNAVDTSGSLSQSDVDTIQQGLEDAFDDQFIRTTSVQVMLDYSVVEFDNSAVVALAPSSINSLGGITTLQGLINAFSWFDGGGTNTAAGITLCEEQFSYPFGATQVINVITDGNPNSDQAAFDAADAAEAAGVDVLNALAIGVSIDQDFLDTIIFGPTAEVFQTPDVDGFLAAYIEKLQQDIPVAGELLPINTSAVLIGGVLASGFWIVPLVGLAGVGAFLARGVLHKVEG